MQDLDNWVEMHADTEWATNLLIWRLQRPADPFPTDPESVDEWFENFIELVVAPGASTRGVAVAVADSILGRVLVTPTYEPSLASLDALLASGQLGLIRSGQLRSVMASFPASLRDAQDEELLARDQLRARVLPILGQAGSLVRVELIGPVWSTEDREDWPKPDSTWVTSSPELVNALATRANLSFGAVGALSGLREDMATMLALVDAELN